MNLTRGVVLLWGLESWQCLFSTQKSTEWLKLEALVLFMSEMCSGFRLYIYIYIPRAPVVPGTGVGAMFGSKHRT